MDLVSKGRFVIRCSITILNNEYPRLRAYGREQGTMNNEYGFQESIKNGGWEQVNRESAFQILKNNLES
jgi:hypothetical protein